MIGIVLTLVAVIAVMLLAFCASDDRSSDAEAVAAAWAPEFRKK